MLSEFTTSRWHVRPLRPDDSSFMLKLLNTPGWKNFIGNSNIHHIGDALFYIQKILKHPDYYCYVIETLSNDEPAGILTLLKRGTDAPFDFGFALLPLYEGKGYAYESSVEFLQQLKTFNIQNRIIARTLPQNVRSIALLERLGFKYLEEQKSDSEILLIFRRALNNH
jgi:[ribosomal protein S5]-alanine N-acetyltransferase